MIDTERLVALSRQAAKPYKILCIILGVSLVISLCGKDVYQFVKNRIDSAATVEVRGSVAQNAPSADVKLVQIFP